MGMGQVMNWVGLIGGIVGIIGGVASVFSAKSAATSNRIAEDALNENKKITKLTLEDVVHRSEENDVEWEYVVLETDDASGRGRVVFETVSNEVIEDTQVRVVRENDDVTDLTEVRVEGRHRITVLYPHEWDGVIPSIKTAFVISWRYARSGKRARQTIEPYL